jgi:long-chain acyl-CoA synthetase
MGAPGKTLVEVFVNRVAMSPDAVAMRVKVKDEWQPTTFREFDTAARETANGLLSLGVAKGDFVAILSSNRPEWEIADVGILMTGAVTVPVYVTNSPSQVAHVIGHSASGIAIVENAAQLDKIHQVAGQLPSLRKVVVMNEGDASGDNEISMVQLRQAGREFAKANPGALQERIASIVPDDLATVVYTSGTTGAPKGAMLTHGNFAWTLECLGQVLHFIEGKERVISYLPLSHVFERLASDWGGICYGFDVWFCESTDKLLAVMKECRPTFFIGVPRVFEKFYAGVRSRYATHEKAKLIAKAVDAGLKRFELEQSGRKVPLMLKAKTGIFDKLIFSKTREELGMDAVRFAVTAAAPIGPDVMKFIHAIGVDLIEAYGQTEVNGPSTVTPAGKARIGTVGPAIPGLVLKFEPDGEILVKGPNVFKGYYKEPEATAAALTEDGFLKTGDVGELDSAGYLRITDRKKDIIITAGGKNVAPQELEGRLTSAELISQALVIGDGRPFICALLTLDEQEGPKWAKKQGIEFDGAADLAQQPKLLAAIEAEVARVNSGLSQVETIKKWSLLPNDFTQDAGEITPTFKVKRKVILNKYSDIVERMYVK